MSNEQEEPTCGVDIPVGWRIQRKCCARCLISSLIRLVILCDVEETKEDGSLSPNQLTSDSNKQCWNRMKSFLLSCGFPQNVDTMEGYRANCLSQYTELVSRQCLQRCIWLFDCIGLSPQEKIMLNRVVSFVFSVILVYKSRSLDAALVNWQINKEKATIMNDGPQEQYLPTFLSI